MKKYKAIIYDIDGTLLNTVDQNMYPLIRIIKEELNEDWTYEQVVPFTANPGMRTLQILGIRDIDTVYARWVRYVNEYGPGAQPYEGIEALLDAAEEKGLKQGIVSSKRQKQYGIDMGRHGYDRRMDAAVLFEDTPVHKPDPEPMFECLRRLGVEAKDALYLGDARSDMVAARAAGMDFAYASWGSFFPWTASRTSPWWSGSTPTSTPSQLTPSTSAPPSAATWCARVPTPPGQAVTRSSRWTACCSAPTRALLWPTPRVFTPPTARSAPG